MAIDEDAMRSDADIKRAEANESLGRMQSFNTDSLPREKELGSILNFGNAVKPAERLIELYKRIPVTVLEDFPLGLLTQIATQANNDYNRLKQILEFPAGQSVEARDNLIAQLENGYDQTFKVLHPFVSYSASKSADFQRLETEGRAMIQTIEDRGNKLAEVLEKKQEEADNILGDIRKAAAEQGVSQQSFYFREAATDHEGQATKWLIGTFVVAAIMVLYAIGSLFIHKIPYLTPDTMYASIQLGISKTLLFAVISYMLYLCARNFLAHKHNAIINKHRQSALMTYTAIMDAAKDTKQKEVVLTYAASCIFSPQSSGYSRSDVGKAPSAKSVVELLAKPFTQDE